MTKTYFGNGKSENDLDKLNLISNEYVKLTLHSKEKHVGEMSEKLNNCLTVPKTYLAIMNRVLNNIKIPLISSLLVHGEKTELFNKLFFSQCSLVKNSSTLSSYQVRTNKAINKVSIIEDDITQIIKKLIPNKSYDCYNVSIH